MANPACGTMPATFFEMLASCLLKDPNTGAIFLNVACYDYNCFQVEPALACGDNTSDPEAYVVANAFTVDACGYPVLKLRLCETIEGEPA